MKRVLCVLVLGLCAWTTPARAEQAAGALEGHAADSSGARLPGVTVEVAKERDTRAIASTTTGEDGSYRFASLAPGAYVIRCALQGFSTSHAAVRIEAGSTATIAVTLDLAGLSESVQVTATEIALDTTTATHSTSFSNQTLTELPTASRNYTHIIVGEAGVNAPLPDRTGKGLNIATTPGAQGDDASQSLNPSVNGARPTNNGLRINGIDTTNMLSAGGGLGNNVGIPLEALD